MLEIKIEGMENEIKNIKDSVEKVRNSNTGEISTPDVSEIGRMGSMISSVAGPRWSMASEDRLSNLSTRKVIKIKNWFSDKEKEERKSNIVIKDLV